MSADGADDAYPWDWLLYRALECGMSAAEFWAASPRAVVVLYRCGRKTHGGRGGQAGRGPTGAQAGAVRLSRIPR